MPHFSYAQEVVSNDLQESESPSQLESPEVSGK